MGVKVECAWCHHEVDDSIARDVTFLGHTYTLCEECFQLIWRGFSGLKALSEQFKAASTAVVRK